MRSTAISGALATAVIVHLLIILSGTAARAQTGSITGKVYDKRTGKPLGYANVILVGTKKGAMTMDDGRFAIQGLPAGKYTVKAMMMGFASIERSSVVVDPSEVTHLEFALEETIAGETPPIYVLAEKPLVRIDDTQHVQDVSAKDFQNLPVDDAMDVVELMTGVVKTSAGYHVRGGRPNENQTQVDGVIVDDPLGSGALTVNRFGFANNEMISGGMDAEYGNAQSAIFSITTKEPGAVFGGEFRYMTDDFGRQDKTYTNYDNMSIGLGGPTPLRSLRYYVSAEATFADGENTTVEPRQEHKITDWLKARDRMSHYVNLQGKLTWNKAPVKITGDAIYQRSRFDQYLHNWNTKGYVQKVYYFQRLRPTGTDSDVYTFGSMSPQYAGPWLEAVNDPNRAPNPRPVRVQKLVRDPETGKQILITFDNFRALDVNGVTLLWDEAIGNGPGVTYKPWVLFEGFQFPESKFSNFQEDSSYVFFNAASRTPATETSNLLLKLGFNHSMLNDRLLYALKLSRLEFYTNRSVGGKSPSQYESAGMPVTLPDGTYLEGGVSDPVWYTDADNPFFVTAYDFPRYTDRTAVQYTIRGDLTSHQLAEHRVKTGGLLIYNDLENDDRAFPAERRLNAQTGTYQQGRNVNLFHNFNTEGAAYIQDKWEHEGMVINAGLRFEFFSTGNSDQIIVNNTEIDKSVEQYKTNWSPRLGVSFPISDRDKFFFHYGRFTQWPGRAYLFAPQDAIGALDPLGNPNLGEELTVSYQGGIAHQFTEDLVANFVVFYKDIYGLVSSTWVTDDTTGVRSRRWINKTYASSRGLEVGVNKSLRQRWGFSASYTYSFADGVASDADFGRSAEGLTHLPTDELPLDWDQRHVFNLTVTLHEPNNWGATFVYQYGSGLPWTPYDRFARLQDPKLENSRSHPATHRLKLQARKKFNIYGRQLTLFVEGRNLLNQDIPRSGGDRTNVFPQMVVADTDNGSYLTETGQYGGAYLLDIDDDGVDDFVPVDDPTVWEEHRVFRVGFGFEF
jgi:hypothetical protein